MELVKLVECFGSYESLGQCFRNAERHTDVEVSLIRLKKPCPSYETEFDGFFLEEEQEQQADAIMPYNLIRDLVNRYVGAVKTFDQQIEAAVKMNQLTEGFFKSPIAMSLTQDGVLKTRNDFKKDFQKAAWDYLFEKLNMQHYATRGLKEYINQFVEQQAHIPFTMANIYRMLEIVIGTQESRMDKALLEIFDKITKHHDENRYYVEGWKTNSHFLVGKQFILPGLCYQDPRYNKGSSKIEMAHGDQMDFIDDLIKGLCHLSGSNYKRMGNLASWVRSPVRIVTDQEVFYCHEAAGWQGQASREEALRRAGIPYTVVNDKPMYGEWFDWAFFRCKAFKKGSMHFEFKDPKLWELFNQRIAKIKGYALFEAKEQTAYQKRRTGRK
ncbi:MAG: DUF4942 domain-containing protein [Puia sp.]|nr:DUF4942 domain-containing protein [Puia sp.]